MANIDTGLGWSADSEWLLSVPANVISTYISIGGSSYLDQPIPYAETMQDGALIGYYLGDYQTAYVSARKFYAYCNTRDAEMLFCYAGNNGYVISNSANAQFRLIRVILSSGTVESQTGTTASRFDATTGLYYNTFSLPNLSNFTYLNPNFPQFSTIRDALDAVSQNTVTVGKANSGYSVACNAKWKTSSGTIRQATILISSDRDACQLVNLDSYPEQESVHQKYGIRFTMRMVYDIPGSITSTLKMLDISQPDSPYATTNEIFNLISQPQQANILVNETVDPYDPFGNSEEGGGETDPNPQDDNIEEEDLPTLSFSSAGFARIYRPSLQQINDLADYMWTDQTFLQTVINHLKQLLENPMDAVISLGIVPCVPPVGADIPVKVMYVNTGVSMPPVTNQFVTVDCGSFTLKEMYGSALDYNPYTKVQLYLPYVGTVKLDTDEVMGKTLQVKYNIDVVTGVCCAYVIAGGDVLYQFSGHCSINQPISSADFSSYINAAIAAAKVGIAAATGGAAAAAGAAAGGAPAPAPAVGGGSAAPELPPSTALVPAMPSGPYHVTPNYPSGSGIRIPNINFAELAKPGNINTVASAMGGKVDVMHSGGFGGNSGYLAAVRRPYLIVTRPRIANPQQYGQFNGRPSMMYLNLGSCTGYTQVQSVYLTGFDATNPELAEISELLKGGVVL